MNLIILCFFALQSCNREQHEADYARLQRIDTLCDSLPAAAHDSLATLHPKDFSRYNRAYYGLLKTIADDKTYTRFTSDSLINDVENYFRRHEKGTDNHLRALVYQGIVRIRTGITDSTAYIPLKDAETLYLNRKNTIPSIGYMLYYHLGDIQEKNGNDGIAAVYFQEALKYAKKKNVPSHLFSIYYKVFWESVRKEQYRDAELYLDTLALYAHTPDERYLMLDAQAFYLDSQGEYGEDLQKKRGQLALTPQLKEEPEYFKIYYSLSDRFRSLHLLDSAFHYAGLAIAHIEDSTYRYNYLLYDNVADIAAEMGDYRLADDYRQQALDIYGESTEHLLDTRILELEKRYDLSEAENKILKAENRFYVILGMFVFFLFAVLIFLVYFIKQRSIVRLQQAKMEEEKTRMEIQNRLFEAETQNLRQKTENQEQLLSHYGAFLKLYSQQQIDIQELAYKVRSRNQALGDTYDQMLKESQQRFADLAGSLFTVDDMGKLFEITIDKKILKDRDCLLLFMLAANVGNEEIAALLNITTNNLKVKKSNLKKKIATHTTTDNGFKRLLEMF